MTVFLRTFSVFTLLVASHAFAASPELATVFVNTGKTSDVITMLRSSGQWKADSTAQFAKLDLRFTAPVTLNKVEVQSCGTSYADGADLYVNFDEQVAFAEGGKPILTFTPSVNLPSVQARALTFNFRYNKEVCVSAIRLLQDGKPIKISVPFLDEKGKAGTTALHDGRLDTTWAADETGGSVVVKFENEVRIKQIRVWNGDQRTTSKFQALPRVKSLLFFGEESKGTAELKDLKGMQTIDLSDTVKGKSIRIAVDSAYGGKPENARLTELQIGKSGEFYQMDIAQISHANADARKSAFKSAGLEGILDRNLSMNDDNENWSVRVRSDGTFFMRGKSENLKRARTFTFLGTYSIQESNKKNVRIKIVGILSNPIHEQDSSTCARDCGDNPGPQSMELTDEISFGRGKDGIVFVRDEGPRRANGLEFHALKARVAKEGD
jgi:hypothetical protein